MSVPSCIDFQHKIAIFNYRINIYYTAVYKTKKIITAKNIVKSAVVKNLVSKFGFQFYNLKTIHDLI